MSSSEPSGSVTPAEFRAALGQFASGITIMSTLQDGVSHAMTANAFTSVSLDPPLVLVSVARAAGAARHLGRVPFTVNVLGATQLDLALHFSGRLPGPAKVGWQSTSDHLAPTLDGALASYRCEAWHSYDGGDHQLHLGRVVEVAVRGDGEPLLFDRGRFWDGVGVELASADVSAA